MLGSCDKAPDPNVCLLSNSQASKNKNVDAFGFKVRSSYNIIKDSEMLLTVSSKVDPYHTR